ncbi:MAG: DUF4179 domain-containing protein [Clostridium sp.]
MNNNFDKDIEKILNEEVEIPKSILDKKELAFSQIKSTPKSQRKNTWKTGITAALVILTLLGGVAFGDNVVASVRNYFNLNKDQGYEKALTNDYVQNLNNKIVSKNGVDINLVNLVRDSSRICTTFSLKIHDKDLFKQIAYIKPNITLKTKDGKVIPNTDNFNFNLNSKTQEITINSVSTLANPHYEEVIKSFNDIDNIIISISSLDVLTSLSNNTPSPNIPKVSEGDIKDVAKSGLKFLDIVSGPWDFNVAIDKKFNNAKPIEFTQTNNQDYINILSAKMLPTGIDITYSFKNEAEAKHSELYEKFNSISLVDSKGNTYSPTNYALQELRDDGKTYITQTFPATIFDKIDNLTLKIKDNNGNVQEVKLSK